MQIDKGINPDWRERISEKKVIFFNTGVSSLLKGNKKHIEKINFVFDEFKKHQDVVLWWRPHPLEMTTLESMCPMLRDYYIETKQRFKNENIGILDESSDLNRAIAVSDAYYGCFSSIVQLYRLTGKPVLLSVNEINTYGLENKTLLWINDICIDENKAYAISMFSNHIYIINTDSSEIESIVELRKEFPIDGNIFSRIKVVGSKLIVVPNRGNNIAVVDIKSKDVVYCKTGGRNNFNNYEIISISEDKMQLLKRLNGEFLEYDLNNNKLSDGKKTIGKNISDLYICENNMYGVKINSNIVYKLSITMKKISELYVGEKDDCFYNVACIENIFVIPHANNPKITIWNADSKTRFDITNFPVGFIQVNDLPYNEIIEYEGNIFLFPYQSNMILKVDLEKKTVICLREFSDYNKYIVYSCVKQKDNNVYCFNLCNNEWDVFDLDKEEISQIKVCFSDDLEEQIKNRPMLYSDMSNESFEGLYVNENIEITLKRFLNSIQYANSVEYSGNNRKIGYIIHNEMKNN